MKIFRKKFKEGSFIVEEREYSLEWTLEKIHLGWILSGRVRGKPGRLEIIRLDIPERMLINNWQSWGPCKPVNKNFRLSGIKNLVKENAETLNIFSPVPDLLEGNILSDYFIAWDGGLLGFLSSRIAHPFFITEGDEMVGYLDFFEAIFEEWVPLEKLLILEGSTVELLLEIYADAVKKENEPKIPTWNPIGWCSWYQYFGGLKWSDVEKNLKLSQEFPFEVFQIDDAYEKDIGDWLETKEGFPSLEYMAESIKEKGFKAGIWLAPFSVSETSSVFKKHKDWLVKKDGVPKVAYKNWGKKIYALDLTNEEVLFWLADLFSSLKKVGFDYFKIDFLFAGAVPGARKKNVTPIQAYREGMRVIRKVLGSSFILGCGAPLLPSIGFVDGMRIGEDTAPFWNFDMPDIGFPNAYHALRNALTRSFMHRKFWLNDPDCLILRHKDVNLTPDMRKMYAYVSGALDNMLIESDDLSKVDSEGKRILLESINMRGGRSKVKGVLDGERFIIETEGSNAGNLKILANLSKKVWCVEEHEVPAASSLIFKDERRKLTRRTERREDGRLFHYYQEGDES